MPVRRNENQPRIGTSSGSERAFIEAPAPYHTKYRFVVDFRRRRDHATNQEALSAGPLIRLSHAVRIVAARTSGRFAAKRADGGGCPWPASPSRPIARRRARQRAVRADRRKILRTERLFRFGQS